VNAHLVGSPGLQSAFDQGNLPNGAKGAVMRDRVLAPAFLDKRHLLAIMARPRDGAAHRSGRRRRMAGNQG
jgi:hypothetical protein